MNTKPKIALACTSFSGGGAERVMINLANKFIEWGFPVDYIVISDKGPYKELLDKRANINILTNKPNKKAKKLSVVLNYIKYLRKSDALSIMSTLKELNVLTVILAKLFFKGTIVIREADTLDRLFNEPTKKNKILLLFMNYSYKYANCIIANCKETKSDLLKNINNIATKTKIIYNPLDLKKIKADALAPVATTFDIVTAGRLTNKKNFKDFILAIEIVKNNYTNISAAILGEGDERKNLQNLINSKNLNSHIKLIGFNSKPYVYFQNAKVFVQTSLWEGFGYVLAEAMACGTSVVAYDSKGAMREILDDGKYGILSPVGNIVKLAENIEYQMNNPTSKELLEEAVQRFDIDHIAKQYLDTILDNKWLDNE